MSASFDDYALVVVLYYFIFAFFVLSLSIYFRVEFSPVRVKDEQPERHDDDEHQFKND